MRILEWRGRAACTLAVAKGRFRPGLGKAGVMDTSLVRATDQPIYRGCEARIQGSLLASLGPRGLYEDDSSYIRREQRCSNTQKQDVNNYHILTVYMVEYPLNR